ncbi:MAG: D-lyxose/D-mannose family sugar isomerase [Anaerolineae bacterium]|nr:D-lyxose/D-mannose family sugar isomerase [Anaerolineae bacterium]
MKRSEINRAIAHAIAFLQARQFPLPPWAYWSPDQWRGKGDEVAEIVACGLGWDITDFGSGDFERVGLTNFNLRNGIVHKTRKAYCEKVLIVEENQVTPLHTHRLKLEDIINRGGGNLVIELFLGDGDFRLTDKPVTVRIDSIARTVPASGKVVLTPGESIFLEPGVFHKFYGEAGAGTVLVGEVSSVNDDQTDNVFYEDQPRFPQIIEDEEPSYLLVNDYKKYVW